MLVNGVQYKEHHTALCRGYVSVKNNEEPKRTKIHDWDTREVFFASGCLLEA